MSEAPDYIKRTIEDIELEAAVTEELTEAVGEERLARWAEVLGAERTVQLLRGYIEAEADRRAHEFDLARRRGRLG